MQKYQKTLFVNKSKKREPENNISKYELIKKHHKFLRDSDSEQQEQQNTQEKKQSQTHNDQKGGQIAKQYYDSLYKQFALVDLSRYQSGQIGCRWRTQKQVLKGKGQKTCAEVKCTQKTNSSYQMNFKYKQNNQTKNALVKVSVCKSCANKLNYRKQLKQIQTLVKRQED